MHDDIGMERAELAAERSLKLSLVAMDVGDRRRQRRFVVAAMAHVHLVAGVDECADEERSAELGATDDQNAD